MPVGLLSLAGQIKPEFRVPLAGGYATSRTTSVPVLDFTTPCPSCQWDGTRDHWQLHHTSIVSQLELVAELTPAATTSPSGTKTGWPIIESSRVAGASPALSRVGSTGSRHTVERCLLQSLKLRLHRFNGINYRVGATLCAARWERNPHTADRQHPSETLTS